MKSYNLVENNLSKQIKSFSASTNYFKNALIATLFFINDDMRTMVVPHVRKKIENYKNAIIATLFFIDDDMRGLIKPRIKSKKEYLYGE